MDTRGTTHGLVVVAYLKFLKSRPLQRSILLRPLLSLSRKPPRLKLLRAVSDWSDFLSPGSFFSSSLLSLEGKERGVLYPRVAPVLLAWAWL